MSKLTKPVYSIHYISGVAATSVDYLSSYNKYFRVSKSEQGCSMLIVPDVWSLPAVHPRNPPHNCLLSPQTSNDRVVWTTCPTLLHLQLWWLHLHSGCVYQTCLVGIPAGLVFHATVLATWSKRNPHGDVLNLLPVFALVMPLKRGRKSDSCIPPFNM